MIYVIGLDSDRTFRYFVSQATARGMLVTAINLRAVVQDGDWQLILPDNGCSWLSTGGDRYNLDPHGAYYCRIIDLSSVQSEPALALRWRSLLESLNAWLEHIPGIVANRPGTGADNFSKPLHEYALMQAGFLVPPSLTSSNPQTLTNFAIAGQTIVKPVSGIRADSRLVTAAEFVDFHPSQGPVHLQRYIPGGDVRVHVVGKEVHAELIRCSQVDYRQFHQEAEYIPCTLPTDLCQRIITTTRDWRLTFAGWDFKVAEDGTYWCLEANPMPGYDGYDRRLRGCITDSLLRLLAGKKDLVKNRV